MKLLLVDLDHTISDAGWRDRLIPEDHRNGDWDAYHSALGYDQPIQEVVDMVLAMKFAGWSPVGLTARPGKWRDATEFWLRRNGITALNRIIMRPDDSWQPTAALKWKLFNEHFRPLPRERVLVLDDHASVAQQFAANGYTVLQVHARKERDETYRAGNDGDAGADADHIRAAQPAVQK